MHLKKIVFVTITLLFSTFTFANSNTSAKTKVIEAVNDFCPTCSGLIEHYKEKTTVMCNGQPDIVEILTSDGGSILLGLKATSHPYFQSVDAFSNKAFNCNLNVWSRQIEKYIEKISVSGTSTSIY